MKIRIRVIPLIMTILSGLFTAGLVSCRPEQPDKGLDVLTSLRDVSKLQLAQMTIGKVGEISDPDFKDAKTLQQKTTAALDKIKIGKRLGVYSYDTYISAYIDLSELTPDDVTVDESSGTIILKLPPVKVEYDGRDLNLKEEHYRVTGLRSQIRPEERARLKEQMGKELKKEVAVDPQLEQKLRATAENKALRYFSLLISDRGYEPVVSFR